MKENIRPSYSQLQGYLNQLSQVKITNNSVKSSGMWESYHNTLGRLTEITHEEYNDFKLEIKTARMGLNDDYKYNYVELDNFLFQLGGLITLLYGEYFFEERNPLDGTPSTVINTTQNQSQSLKFEIIVEMTELITKQLENYKKDTPERNFLEKVKDGLKDGKGITELINLILKTGTSLGLTAATILQLLSR
jgi:hypothetical protein